MHVRNWFDRTSIAFTLKWVIAVGGLMYLWVVESPFVAVVWMLAIALWVPRIEQQLFELLDLTKGELRPGWRDSQLLIEVGTVTMVARIASVDLFDTPTTAMSLLPIAPLLVVWLAFLEGFFWSEELAHEISGVFWALGMLLLAPVLTVIGTAHLYPAGAPGATEDAMGFAIWAHISFAILAVIVLVLRPDRSSMERAAALAGCALVLIGSGLAIRMGLAEVSASLPVRFLTERADYLEVWSMTALLVGGVAALLFVINWFQNMDKREPEDGGWKPPKDVLPDPTDLEDLLP